MTVSRAYVILNGIGLIIALLILDRSLPRQLGRQADLAYVLFLACLPVGWLGAHLLDSFIRGKSFLMAGFIFYGGLISSGIFFCTFGTWFLGRRSTWIAVNMAIIPLLLAHAIGRIGCYIGGCCYGRMINSLNMRHPVQLYEAASLLAIAGIIAILERRGWIVNLAIYLIMYPFIRFFLEFLRADDRGVFFCLSTSQMLSIPLFIGGILLLLWMGKMRRI